jgi:translation initiation factor 1
MSKGRIVWSDEGGDQRKKKDLQSDKGEVDPLSVTIYLRRLTSGKGRTIIELSNLPSHKSWCKKLAKDCKKSLGVGGSYKNDCIEVHGEKMDEVMQFLNSQKLNYKKTGG